MTGQARAEGRIALVTGAGAGIGRAVAVAFAREGAAAVVVGDLDAEAAAATATLVTEQGAAHGTKAIAVGVDVSDSAAVDEFVGRASTEFGRLDLAVNSAGVSGPYVPVGECTDEAWLRVTRVNLDGVFYCVRAQVNAMLPGGGGAIVNISSGGAVNPKLGQSAYSASKAGVGLLTRVAAGEYVRRGIRINNVQPGAIMTEMTARHMDTAAGRATVEAAATMGRLGEPEEVADTVLWLCSAGASYVTGASILVDGGSHAFRP